MIGIFNHVLDNIVGTVDSLHWQALQTMQLIFCVASNWIFHLETIYNYQYTLITYLYTLILFYQLPAGSMTVPPASLTRISPAAMSHACTPISTYKSIPPLATCAKFQAAEPAERILKKKSQ